MLDGKWNDFVFHTSGYQTVGIKSTRIPFTYVGILPVSALRGELKRVWGREIVTYLVLVCVLIVIIIGHMWSIFNPLNQLMAEVSGDKPRKLWLGRYFVTELQGIMLENAEQKTCQSELSQANGNGSEKKSFSCNTGEEKYRQRGDPETVTGAGSGRREGKLLLCRHSLH